MNKIWMIALVSVLMLVGCANENPATAIPTPMSPATPLPAAAPAPNPVQTPIAPATPRSPRVVSVTYLPDPPSSLDELVFLSDIIARVRLISAAPDVETVDYREEGGIGAIPIFLFRFEAIEYLKGSGGSELTVKVPAIQWPDLSDRESAQAQAASMFPLHDARWNDREAIIFLEAKSVLYGFPMPKGASDEVSYRFRGPREDVVDIHEYAITSDYNKAWLPASAPSGPSGATGSSEPEYLTESPQGVAGATSASAPSISLSEIKKRIKANNDLLTDGRDIPGYEFCVKLRFRTDARIRAGQAGHYTLDEFHIESGLPAGHRILSLTGNAIYPEPPTQRRWWTTGPDSDLFIIRVTDDHDNDPDTVGYAWEDVTTRPIPRGVYRVFYIVQPAIWVPCDYNPELRLKRSEGVITVTAPDGTLHEAFFDPVATGAAVGAGGSNGVLKPASFTKEGISISIERIEWADRQVKMRLSPHSRLTGHHIDFIALHSSLALRLDFDDATEVDEGGARALSWGVCIQPWQDGDLLMLRISKSEDDLIGATNSPQCVPTPTATPTPTTTSNE